MTCIAYSYGTYFFAGGEFPQAPVYSPEVAVAKKKRRRNRKVSATPLAAKEVALVDCESVSLGQCSMPRSPRFNGVGEIDPHYWGHSYPRIQEGNQRQQVQARTRRRRVLSMV